MFVTRLFKDLFKATFTVMSDRLLVYIAFIFILRHVQGTENFVLRKPAVQSTTGNYKNFNWTADKAVDGNMQCGNPENSMSCSATQNTDAWTNHTWEVDIGHQIIMKTITVYGRTDVTHQLDRVKLYIGNATSPWTYNQELPSSSANLTLFVYNPNYMIARFISLWRNGTILVICEVTVEGECVPGEFGANCSGKCGNCLLGDVSCSKLNGSCSGGCKAGWQDDDCKRVCKNGTYGFNCNETCGQCLNGNNTCSQLNGTCKGGCQAGWEGETCKSACKNGTYGFNCNETCGQCINGNNTCSKLNGTCKGGCQAGWEGETCKSACKKGTYGFKCNETCGQCIHGNNTCSQLNGTCIGGCQAGWEGEICKSACKSGTYGFNCNETCGQCLNGNRTCLQFNGTCSGGCQAGWEGETCKSGCKKGKFGYNCNETCGYCLHGNITCFTSNGSCNNGCDAGWQDDDCKQDLDKISEPDSETKFPGGAVGGAVAALVLIAVIVIMILVFHRKRKRNNNETSAEMTNATNYANLVVENLAKTATTGSASHDISRIRNGPIGAIPANRGVMEPDAHVNNDYEKLHVHTESTEFHYSSIDQAFMHQQEMKSLENCSSYVQSLQSLEGALRSVEEEITVVLNKKEKLLSRELERARGNKIGDKKKVKDSTFPDKDRDLTIHNYVQTLQSLEEELRNLEEKKKCLLERKEILLREELVKTTESGI